MINTARLFDSYSRQARLYPALLTLLPGIFLAITWIPGVLNAGQTIIAIVAGCGFLYFLADLARTRGKRLEASLLKEWGGWPTTIWLRHADDHLPVEGKRRYHAFLSKQPQIRALPTPEEERNGPRAADERYAASVLWLKERCRGAKFPLVEKENATYGFRRNLLGLKPIGIGLCVVCILTPLIVAAFKNGWDASHPVQFVWEVYLDLPGMVAFAILVSAIALLIWVAVVTRRGVREAADQYARALLANCDSLAA
jgi:hypothetical protein